MLEVKGLSVCYGSRPVLTNVEFSVPSGCLLSVLGNNGAGKTTLLKAIIGLVRRKTGLIRLNGMGLSNLSHRESARIFAYVAQTPRRCGLSVFESILLGRRPHMSGRPSAKDYRVVEDALTCMGLNDLAFQRLDCISGGELQKAAIARALAQEPQVLLLDEPISNLDMRNQMEVETSLCNLAETRGLMVIQILHDLDMAMRFSNRFLFLKHGRIHAMGGREIVTEDVIYDIYGVHARISEVHGIPVVVVI
ncbi:MAG: ABC transporter ATP-binding protein [Dissulfuribacterales bacterium]